MKHQLMRYEGLPPTEKETVVGESTDLDELYDLRDRLDANPISLSTRRHGVRAS